jgi:hypothetical protein
MLLQPTGCFLLLLLLNLYNLLLPTEAIAQYLTALNPEIT